MIKRGNPPYLECSSKGDKRFSAFYARIKARNNKSIEEIYQAAKIFEDGSTGLSWKEAKGKKAVNMSKVAMLYDSLWVEYLFENHDLFNIVLNSSGFSDIFGKEGCQCQADTLCRIKEVYIKHAKGGTVNHES